MTTPEHMPDCAEYESELVRVETGASAAPSAGLAAHLTSCAACAERVRAAGELLDALHSALRPTRLSAGVVRAVHGRWPERPRRPGHAVRLFAIGVSAAAAVVLGAVLIPQARTGSSAVGEAGSGMSMRDSLAWLETRESDAVLYAEDVLIETTWIEVQDLSDAMSRDPGTATWLPWGPDEDWDLPRLRDGQSSRPADGTSV